MPGLLYVWNTGFLALLLCRACFSFGAGMFACGGMGFACIRHGAMTIFHTGRGRLCASGVGLLAFRCFSNFAAV